MKDESAGIPWEELMSKVNRPMNAMEVAEFQTKEILLQRLHERSKSKPDPSPLTKAHEKEIYAGMVDALRELKNNHRFKPIKVMLDIPDPIHPLHDAHVRERAREDTRRFKRFKQKKRDAMGWKPHPTPAQLKQAEIEKNFARQQEKESAFFKMLPGLIFWFTLVGCFIYKALKG